MGARYDPNHSHYLVTDAPPPPELEEALREKGVQVVLPAAAPARER